VDSILAKPRPLPPNPRADPAGLHRPESAQTKVQLILGHYISVPPMLGVPGSQMGPLVFGGASMLGLFWWCFLFNANLVCAFLFIQLTNLLKLAPGVGFPSELLICVTKI